MKLCVGTCMGRDLIPPEPQQVEDKRLFAVGWLKGGDDVIFLFVDETGGWKEHERVGVSDV